MSVQMPLSERLTLAALKLFARGDAERARDLTLLALRWGLGPRRKPFTTTRLKTKLAGLDLLNPVGMAAGLDKDAEVVRPLLGFGFGFVELGTVTPQPQEGNPKPRLFSLDKDQAVINRFGFKSDGMNAVAERLQARPQKGILGINIGANKDSTDHAEDYIKVLNLCASHADFATINISSPNTVGLRDLQGKGALPDLLKRVMEARDNLPRRLPIFLKIAPDLADKEIAAIAETAIEYKIDSIIATNTTLDRPETLASKNAGEDGGLSGQPLFDKSTRALARLAHETGGKIPLVGVGGVSSAEQAFDKIQAGATAVQLYTAMFYQGHSVIEKITKGLDAILEREGFASVSEATGSDIDKYLKSRPVRKPAPAISKPKPKTAPSKPAHIYAHAAKASNLG